MKRKPKILIAIPVAIFLLLLLTCALGLIAWNVFADLSVQVSDTSTALEDIEGEAIIVYDGQGKELGRITHPTFRDSFSELIGEAGKNANLDSLRADLPKATAIRYRYLFVQKDKNRLTRIEANLYEDQKAIYFLNLPIVGNLAIPLSDEDYETLAHPEPYFDKA